MNAGPSEPSVPASPPRRVRLTPAANIRPQRVDWTWTDRVPAGALTLLAGREGTGKSLASLHVAAQLTRGWLPGCHYGSPRPVAVVAVEDSWPHVLVPRLLAAGADLSLVHRLDVAVGPCTDDGAPPVLPLDLPAVERELRDVGAVCLVVDPLASSLGAADRHRDAEVREGLEPLSRLASRLGIAVVGLAHHGKGISADPGNLILGSRAFTAVARQVLTLIVDPDAEDRSALLCVSKSNLGRLDVPALRVRPQPTQVPTAAGPASTVKLAVLGETAGVDVAELLRRAQSGPDVRGARGEATEWLREQLGHGPVNAQEIQQAAARDGVAAATLRRAAADLQVTKSKTGMSGGWSWALPDAPKVLTFPRRRSTQNGEHLRRGVGIFGDTPDLDAPETDPADPAAFDGWPAPPANGAYSRDNL